MRRVLYRDGRCAGHTKKYVGATARSMGSDPCWVAYPNFGRSVACESYQFARDHVLRYGAPE